jgi:hypothetical protein
MDTKEIKEELKELSKRIKIDWETDPDDLLKIIELFDDFITLVEEGEKNEPNGKNINKNFLFCCRP